LGESKILDRLKCLHLLSVGGAPFLNTHPPTDALDRTSSLDRQIGDAHLEKWFGEDNVLEELRLEGLAGVTPEIVGLVFPKLEGLDVRNCEAFSDPQEVCRLCRKNEALSISNLSVSISATGTFDGAFYDCEGETAEEEEEKKEDGEGGEEEAKVAE
jgi:hypothetical protein